MNKTVLILVLVLSLTLIGCATTTSKKAEVNYSYETLEKTINRNGTRLEILLTEDINNVTKEDLGKFVTSLTSQYDDIAGAVYLTRRAYQEDLSGNYTDAYDNGLLLTYVKNSRANQITFMQEKGKFQNLFGTTMKITK